MTKSAGVHGENPARDPDKRTAGLRRARWGVYSYIRTAGRAPVSVEHVYVDWELDEPCLGYTRRSEPGNVDVPVAGDTDSVVGMARAAVIRT